jgi:predicted permease
MKDQSMVGAFVQASFRGSAAVLGVALIQNVYGNSVIAPLMIVSSVPLYNIYSVIVLTFEAQGGEGDNKKIKNAFINILKNPIIIGIVLGAGASLLRLDFPVLIDKTIGNLAAIATPLALIVIGATFEGKKALAKIKPTIVSSFIKLILQSAIFLPIAAYMGFRGEKFLCLIIMLAAPTTVSCYIMAKNMNNDDVLTSSVIVTTTLLSAFTVTGWIYIAKALELL